VSWSADPNVTSYTYVLNGGVATPATGTTLTFTGLAANTVNTVTVTATNNGGETNSNTLSITTLRTKPTAPVITSQSVSSNGFVLNWQADANVTSYTYTLNGGAITPTSSTAQSATFTTLTPNTPYTIFITATNNGGSTDSNTLSITTTRPAPAAPVISSSAITQTGFTVSWTNNPDVTSYTYTLDGGGVTPVIGTTINITGLIANTSHIVIVTASNNGGSTPSNTLSVTTLRTKPTAPSISSLEADNTSNGFLVTWANDSNVTSYIYTLNGNNVNPTASTATSATFSALVPNTVYSIFITARNNGGDTASNTLSVTTRAAPVITSSAITSVGFTINWPPNPTTTSNTYTIDGTSASPSSSNATSATFTTLSPSTPYNVVVTAFNRDGNAVSNTLAVTTRRTPPTAPVISSSAITSSSFTFSWSADANVASYTYRIGSGSEIPVTGTSVNLTDLSANTLYQVVLTATNDGGSTPSNTLSTTTLRTAPTAPVITSSAITSSSFTVNWSADANVTSYTYRIGSGSEIPVTGTSVNLTGLSANTPYQVVLTAINNGGSAASNTLSVTTLRTAPTAPVISSSAITSTSFVISWSLDTNVTSYTYTLDGGAATPASSTTTSATFTGRTANTAYNVIVTANNNGGSTASNTLAVRTIIDPPTDLSANPITPSRFTLTWTGSAGANNYTFLLGGNVATPTYTPGATTAIFTGLSSSTSYSVQVIATDGTRNSVASTALAVRTPAPPPPITFSSSGTLLPSSYSVPTGYTSMYVEILAGSGGGAGSGLNTNQSNGGGGGAYYYGTTDVGANDTIQISPNVISGGVGGATSSDVAPLPGSNGTSVTFTKTTNGGSSTVMRIGAGNGGNCGGGFGSGWIPPSPTVVDGGAGGQVTLISGPINIPGLTVATGTTGSSPTNFGVRGSRAPSGKAGYTAGDAGAANVAGSIGIGGNGDAGYYLITFTGV
jgi:hypothetical protein